MDNNQQYTQNQYTSQPSGFSDDDGGGQKFDIMLWVLRFLKSWYLFVISLAIFLSIAYVKNRSWQPNYKSSALVIIEENKGLSGAQAALMQGFSVERGYRNVNNQVIMFGSYELISRVIAKQPELTIDYYTQGRFKSTNLYKAAPILITKTFVSPQAYEREFTIQDLGNNNFEISAPGTKQLPELKISGKYGVPIQNSSFFIQVDKSAIYRRNFNICFKLLNPENLATTYSAKLSFDFLMTGASVVQASIHGTVPERDCDFLNGLCEEFLADNLARKNDAAIKTIEFIDDQLSTIADSLRISEGRLKDYKANNFVVASVGGSNLMGQYTQLDAMQTELRLKESYLNYLTNYLKSNVEEGAIIAPDNLGVSDANLSSLVSQFTEMQLKRKEIGVKSPLYAKYTRDIDAVKAQMYEALKNIRVGLDIQKADMQNRLQKLSAGMQELPYKEQQLLNIQRKFKINDDYYTFLVQKRADAQIQKASNSPDNIILDKARLASMTNAGEKNKAYTMFLAIGLLVPVAIIVLLELMVPYIRTESEVISMAPKQYQLLGVIRHTDRKTPVIVDKYPKSAITEAFRVIRTRIEFLSGKSKGISVMVTSSQSGDGKSYISANIAGVFAMTGRKTILVDLDMRKPSINTELYLSANKGISSYLVNQISLEDAIIKHPDYKFDILPVGVVPPNPGELIKSDSMQNLISILKETYDYIIFDTSPIGLVTDAYAIIEYVDIILYAVRCEQTNKSFYKKTMAQLEANNVHKVGLIFNDVNLKKLEYSRYYDGYGSYGHKGGYYYYYNKSKSSRSQYINYFDNTEEEF